MGGVYKGEGELVGRVGGETHEPADGSAFRIIGYNGGTGQENRVTLDVNHAFLRKLARLSPEADKRLRAAVPQAFVGDIVSRTEGCLLASGSGRWLAWGSTNRRATIMLNSDYEWSLEYLANVLPGFPDRPVLVGRPRI